MFKNINKKKLSKGFTLVEILVVLVIVAILAAIAFLSYSDYFESGYATEGKTLLKDVVAASTMYESQHSGEQVSIDVLEAETPFSRTPLLKKRWKVNINGDSFSVISTDAMEGGAGHEITYDRSTGKYSGYGKNEE